MPVRPDGAQRASIHLTHRVIVTALIAALVAGFGALAAPQETLAAASIKVVVVVGPVGSSTGKYRDSARSYAKLARSYGASVTEIYSPYATWSRVRAAAQGANLLIYLGHGNGYPSPYGAFQRYDQGRAGAQRRVRQGQLQHQVLRRVLRRPLHPDGSERGRDPQPAVLRVGQLRVGLGQPDQDDRHPACRQLRCRVPARRREGGLRGGDQQRLAPDPRRCSRAART